MFKYALGRAISRFVCFNCVRSVVLHRERAEAAGGFVLACTHLSHLEPCLVTAVLRRKVDWMARIEFYRNWLFARVLNAMDAFPVDRQGVPVRSIRTAIERARQGRLVGIFPEGGVAQGADSAMRGAPIKMGACVVSYRSEKPMLPVVVLGTNHLNRVGPWLPFKNARVWMIFGEPIYPRLGEKRRRVARELMAADLRAAYQSLYRELCASCGLDERTAAGT